MIGGTCIVRGCQEFNSKGRITHPQDRNLFVDFCDKHLDTGNVVTREHNKKLKALFNEIDELHDKLLDAWRDIK